MDESVAGDVEVLELRMDAESVLVCELVLDTLVLLEFVGDCELLLDTVVLLESVVLP